MYRIFVVFHKYLNDEYYEEIPKDILDKHFVFISVNPDIPKTYTEGKYNVVNEWELPIYNPQLDNSVLRENTAIYHVYMNKLYDGYDYIGFCQYDMRFTTESLNNIQHLAKTSYIALRTDTVQFSMNTMPNGEELLNHIIDSHSKYFGCTYDNHECIPLLNTYILDSTLFEKIMGWVTTTYSSLIEFCKTFDRYNDEPWLIASIYERVMAIGVGAEKLQLYQFDVVHDNKY